MATVVNDFGILGAGDCERLLRLMTSLEAAGEAEFAVMVLPRVRQRAFRAHAVASRRTATRRSDRSVLIVLATEDRHVEIATAACYAGHFTPEATRALLETHVVPLLRAGRSVDALAHGLEAVAALVRHPCPAVEAEPRQRRSHNLVGVLFIVAVWLLIAGFIAFRWSGHGGGAAGAWSSSSDGGSSYDAGSSSGGDSGGGADSGGGSSDGGGGADY